MNSSFYQKILILVLIVDLFAVQIFLGVQILQVKNKTLQQLQKANTQLDSLKSNTDRVEDSLNNLSLKIDSAGIKLENEVNRAVDSLNAFLAPLPSSNPGSFLDSLPVLRAKPLPSPSKK